MKKGYLLFLTVLFFSITAYSATFTSKASTGWSTATTWSVTGGTDADGIPDANDDVIIKTANSVSLTATQNYFKSLTVQSGGTLKFNSKALTGSGNFTNQGTISGAFTGLTFNAPAIFSSTSLVTNAGPWYASASLTITATTSITAASQVTANNSAKITNLGRLQLTTASINLKNTSSFVNGANAFLRVEANVLGNMNFNCAATSNTVQFYGSSKVIPSATYYNLQLTAVATRSLTGDVTVLNDIMLDANSANVLDLKNFNLNIGGNYTNNANTNILNQGVITFNGNGNQIIKRTGVETFKYLEINCSGTVQLNCILNVSESFFNRSGTFDLIGSYPNLLRIQKSFTNNDRMFCNTATVMFNGTTAQSIDGNTDCFFYNLLFSNTAGLTVNSSQSISNSLVINNGNFNSNGNVTLLSDEFTTAFIGKRANATCAITGNMIIQKYISDRVKGWHDLCAPVAATTIMDWDDEIYMSGIGGDDGIDGPGGVDGSAAGFNSVLTYNEPTATWNVITGSGTAVPVGKGFQVWLADDQTNWDAKVISTVGVPTFGNKLVKLSYTAGAGAYKGLNLIGNPFACPVSFSNCTRTNITGSILMLDNSGNYTDLGSTATIPPHQAFWVGASGANASINFLESAKQLSTTTTYYRTIPNYGIKLTLSSPNLPFYHENTINFEPKATVNYEQDIDALYLKSPNLNAPAIYMNTNSDAKLITNNVNSNDDEVTIPLTLFTPEDGIYYINPSVINLENYSYAWIENTKTGKQFELNSSIAINATKDETNNDYTLRLSKKTPKSSINQSVFESDLSAFYTENTLNLKSFNSTHNLKQVTIIDLTGKIVFEQFNVTIEQAQLTKLDLTELARGVFIVTLIDEVGHIQTEKIIK